MSDSLMNPQVDAYIAEGCMRCPLGATPQCKVHAWTEELETLRSLLLASGLTEERKWGVPVYTLDGANVVNMGALKNSVDLGFFKGALLKDPHQLLVKAGENTHVARQFRFTSLEQIKELAPHIEAYLQEAIANEKAGLKVEKPKEMDPMPEELLAKFEESASLKAAFEALTPGRQRGYILHFSQPKQPKTRSSRIEKCIPKIMEGKGFHDR